MNFVTTSNRNRGGFFHFVVGNEKPCVFKLQFDIDTNILSIALNKYGDYEGEEIRIDLKNVEEKIEISYFDNQLYFNGTVVTMKCGIEWMLLDKDTDVIDVLIDNNEQHPTDMNITWVCWFFLKLWN
uniref:Galectin n=1 Tax=Panagrolaimus superbus TaxID=310955 RepID=A0A914YE96_9BILA